MTCSAYESLYYRLMQMYTMTATFTAGADAHLIITRRFNLP